MKKTEGNIGLVEAMSIGIGGMVGGGIFAVLGLAVDMSKGSTPLSFLIAGIIALITSYSYVNLSLSFPDKGGTVRFINEGLGKTVFSGVMNNLLWVSYIIMLSLYASAFGSYAPNLLSIFGQSSDFHLYASAIVIIASVINYYSAKVVGKIESWAVVIKLVILFGFIVLGIYGFSKGSHLSQLAVANWEGSINILTGAIVIFVAYEGFELIANASPDIMQPQKNIPKAFYYSVGFVILLYVIIAIVTIGSLPFDVIATSRDYVLAEAAKPMLGQVGFTIITIAALISTFSAINASLYGGARVSYEIAEDDELPHQLTFQLWNKPIGLFITMVATLIMTNTLNLENISSAGSVGFILIFTVVNYVGMKLSAQLNSNRIIPMLGMISCLGALIVMLIKQSQSNLTSVIISLSVVFGCFIMEWIYKTMEK